MRVAHEESADCRANHASPDDTPRRKVGPDILNIRNFMKRTPSIGNLILFFSATSLYLFFSLRYLHLPGLQYDEVLFANAALGDVDGNFLTWKVRVLGGAVPIMLMNYMGALKAWIYAPILSWWGGSAAAVRLPPVLVGLLTLGATFAFIRRVAPGNIAAAAILLLAADPTFVFANSRDWGPISLSLALRACSLYLFWRWIESGSPRFAAAVGFLLGLGIFDKVIFIWFVAGLVVAAALCYRSRITTILDRRTLVATLGAFSLGCLPLVAFNLTQGLATLEGHGLIVDHWREYLAQRYRVFIGTLDGSMVYYLMNLTDLGSSADLLRSSTGRLSDRTLRDLAALLPIRGTLFPQAFTLSLIALLLIRFRRQLRSAREILFCLILMFVITVFICVIEEASGPHHMIMLYPLPQLVIAFAFSELARTVPNARPDKSRSLTPIVATICLGSILLS